MNRSLFSRRSARARSRLPPIAVWALVGVLTGCSVYDSSLLSDTGSPLANGGDGALGGSADSEAGAVATSPGGSPGSAGQPDVVEEAGAAGDASNLGGASSGGASAGASATSGKSDGGSAHGGSAQGGVAQAGAGLGGSAQAGSAQGGSPASAGAPSADVPHDLSTGKPATASTLQTGNEIEKGNDGNFSTRWCGKDDSLPQWWRVDLGATHQLSSFSVAFQVATRAYTYDIETSSDDKVYTRRLTITGTGSVQSGDFPASVSARYVRITVTKTEAFASGATVWASFYEFSVLGI